MAKALNKASHRNKSSMLVCLRGEKLTAYSKGLLFAGAMLATVVISASPAQSADFTHAQHVFVPPTSIPRHFDSESLNYGNATGDSPDIYPSHDLGIGSTNGARVRTTTQNGKSFNKTFYESSRTNQPKAAASSAANNDASPAMNAFVTQARAKAQLLVKQGKLAAAEDMLQTDLKAVPKSRGLQTELANVRVARARYALKTGDTAQATQHAEAALLVQPDNAGAKAVLAEANQKSSATTASIAEHLSRAKTLTAQASYTEANKEIASAMRIKDTSDVHVSMGDLAYKQGNVETARSEYAKALQMDPESGAALRQTGIFKLHENDIAGANKDLSRALIINSKDKEAGLALQKIWQGQVAKNPTSANAHLGLARAYQLSEELPAAQAEYREVVKLDPQHPSLPGARQSFKLALAKQESIKCLQAAKTLEDAGAFSEAHQKALEAVNISPTCVSARIYQGAICEKLSLYSEAHDAYMTALKYDPKNAIAARHLRALQGMANAAELANGSSASGAGTSAGTASATTNAAAEPKVPQGMYVFKGWQFGHPLANNTASAGAGTASFGGAGQGTMDASGQATAGYAGAQNASYGYGSGTSYNSASGYGSGGGGNPLQALAAGPALALPGGTPTTAQLADPSSPMPLQGVPPAVASASSTTPHVNAFSSFLGSLRDLNVQQKQQSQQAESAISSLGYGSGSGGLGGSSLGGVGGLGGGSLGSPLPGALGSSGAAAGSSALPAVAAPSQSSISSVIAQAAAAVAKAGGGGSSNSAGSGSGSSSSSSGSAGSAGSAGGASGAGNTVSINVNGTNIQISNPSGTTTTATPAPADSGQSLSGAAWDAAPSWLKKKFPNMTQSDFTAIAGKLKGSAKARLQALAAQQKAAAAGNGQEVTPAQAAQALAGILPANFSINGASIPGAPMTSVNTDVAANILPQSFSPGANQPFVPAASDAAEQDLLARAGQDAPTMAPPDVVPDSSGLPSIASKPASATDFGAPVDNSNGLHAQAQSLAMAPPVTSIPTSVSTTPTTSPPMSRSDLPLRPPKDVDSNDNSNASVVLELQGFNPTPAGIRLKVVIKNSRTTSLPLPDSARAIIHMPGQADKEAKVYFTAKEVAPGGLVQGIIKVPGHDLNPAADLVLPNFLPVTFADRDVHLTVPISALVK